MSYQMAELVAENTLASLIPQCLAAVEILHEFLAKDNFCQLGRERIKSEIISGFYLPRVQRTQNLLDFI